MNYEDSVLTLKGVGPKRGAALVDYQIKTVGNLLNFYPGKYIDRNVMKSFGEFTEDGVVSIKALVLGQGRVQRLGGRLSIFSIPLLWEEA